VAGPQIVAVASGSPAQRAGLQPGDEVLTIAGESPRDVIRWQLLSNGTQVALEIKRQEDFFSVLISKRDGEPLGAEVNTAVFDGVQTCDNHCEFCFVHQLPRGMRRSLYLKDDDYRLSFLYGNFTTLTRFNELDYERVISEQLSPLYVSIHATDPDVRAAILQNRRGQTIVPPYAVRPVPEASVSTPLDWDELDSELTPARFTIETMPDRLRRLGDLFAPALHDRQPLLPAIQLFRERYLDAP